MKIYEVVPHEGVGPIRFGMSCTESRAAMNLPLSSSWAPEDCTLPYRQPKDLYHANAFQIFFDEQGKVEYIELSAHDSFKAMYKGVHVHKTKANKLLDLICEDADFDEEDWELGYSYIFPALQLSVWRSLLPQDDKKRGSYFMTIGVGRENLYSPEFLESKHKARKAYYPKGWQPYQPKPSNRQKD